MSRVLVLLFLILILAVAGCADSNNVPFNHDQDTLDELNTILNELDDDTAKTTVEALINSPVELYRNILKVKDNRDSGSLYRYEIEPFENGVRYSNYYVYTILMGDYIRYACKYSEECDSGIVKINYISVFVEVDEDGEFIIPLHLYAYNRVLEKRTGFIEPYKAPEWDNSYTVVGLEED